MHNSGFQHLGLTDWEYGLIPLRPDELAAGLQRLKTEGYVGVNVTIPHKQAIIPYLDELDPVARAIGAVNTVVFGERECWGYNTDCYGFICSLLEANFDPKDRCCVILGAGGSARAVAFSLAEAGAGRLVICNRTVAQAVALADSLRTMFPDTQVAAHPLTEETLDALRDRADLVVNTTSLGMTPQTETTPWPTHLSLPEAALIYDLVYNPLKTRFLQQAQAAVRPAVSGLEMLVFQGVKAFEIWTSRRAPADIMRQVVLEHLQEG
jgi:shikimate dehydrogenase